jgi:hypothetical protein
MTIKNRIQAEMKSQGRSEAWLRTRYEQELPADRKHRRLSYDALYDIRINDREVRVCELYYIAKALGIKDFRDLLELEF